MSLVPLLYLRLKLFMEECGKNPKAHRYPIAYGKALSNYEPSNQGNINVFHWIRYDIILREREILPPCLQISTAILDSCASITIETKSMWEKWESSPGRSKIKLQLVCVYTEKPLIRFVAIACKVKYKHIFAIVANGKKSPSMTLS